MRDAIRKGIFSPEVAKEPVQGPLTFDRFAAIYVERYVKANKLASADTIGTGWRRCSTTSAGCRSQRSRVERPADTRAELAPVGAKCFEERKMGNGVGDGFRTRDFRSHSRKR